MKKLLSLALTAVMLFSAVSAVSFAEEPEHDPIYIQSDFSSLGAAAEDFYVDGFECSMDNIIGYYTGRCFQAKKGFYTYDAICEVNLGPDDASPKADGRFFNFVYNNGGEQLNGLRDSTRFMSFGYDIDKSELYLCADGIGFNSSAVLAGPIPAEGLFADGSTYHKFGMSITEKRIRCFIDGELIFDYIDEENKYCIGYTPENPTEEPPIMLWWTENNLTMFKEIVVTEPEYLFPFPVPVNYGDANGDDKINLADVSLLLKYIAKWEVEPDLVAADVTNDEKVNLADVSLMLKYLAKWDFIVLGPYKKPDISVVATNIDADSITYFDAVTGYECAVIEKDGKFGMIGINGEIVLPIKYTSIEPVFISPQNWAQELCATDEDYCRFRIKKDGSITEDLSGGWGFPSIPSAIYWMNGKPLIYTGDNGIIESPEKPYSKYDYNFTSFSKNSGKDSPVIPVQEISGYTFDFYNILVVEKISDKYALLDAKTGKLLTDFIFDNYTNDGFYEGVLPVQKDGKWGYVTDKGDMITDFVYDIPNTDNNNYLKSFCNYAINGYIIVRQGDLYGLIDKNGNPVADVKYEGITQVTADGYFWAKADGKWSVMHIG